MKHYLKMTLQPRKALVAILALTVPAAIQAMTFRQTGAGAETLFATWDDVAGAVRYEVTYTGETRNDVKVDDILVRRYPGFCRVDVPGVSAGDYTLTVRAYNADGTIADEGVTPTVSAYANNREGFAFSGGNIPGAYKADGTLKDDADVLYVTASTVNTVTLDVAKNNKGAKETKTGLAEILGAIGKGYHKTPLAVRIIGAVTDTDFAGLKDGNYINLQGNNATDRRIENITIEGVGEDATLYGYGVCFKRTHNIEIRNVAIMLFGDDAISMDTDNSNIWLHNIDFFYGKPGRDADQVKGDGSIDMKYRSTDITISYNHFFDSGKVMGCGGTTGEDENLRITYHHNWFDHTDSRCPRLHYTTAHIYNNYYDGVPVYSIGNTTESSAFIECNYFRGCKRPIMTSGQGTDAYDAKTGTYTLKGTFSGQNGGMNKVYDNIFDGCKQLPVYQTEHATQFDAYIVSSRDEKVPAEVTSVKGSWPYSNFDTDLSMYVSKPDLTADVPSIVTSRAGRTGGGDFKWEFDNTKDDEDHSVNTALKSAVMSYKPSLVAVQGEDGFGDLSGIGEIPADAEAGVVYFDLAGRHAGDDFMSLPAGVYIEKSASGVRKIKK